MNMAVAPQDARGPAAGRAPRPPASATVAWVALAAGVVLTVLGVWGLYHHPRRALVAGVLLAAVALVVAWRRHLAAIRLRHVVWWMLLLMPAAALMGPALALPQFRSLFLFRVLVVALIVLLPVWVAVVRPRVVLAPKRLYQLLALWLGWLTLSLFWAADKGAGFRYLGLLALMTLLLGATASAGTTRRRLRFLLGSLGVVYALAVALAVLEAAVSVRLPWASSVGAAKVGVTVTSFFYNANNLATFVAIIWPFLLLAVFTARRWAVLAAGLAGAAGGLWTLFHTGSRTSLVTVVLETVLLVALLAARRQIRGWRLGLILGLVAAILVLFGFLAFNSSSSYLASQFRLKNVASNAQARTGSTGTRLALLDAGARVSAHYLFLGVGPGNAESRILAQPGISVAFGNLHAWWMEVFVDGGLPGFIFYALFYLGLVVALWRRSAAASPGQLRFASTACLVALLGFVVGSFGPSSVFDFAPMWVLFGVSLAILLRAHLDATRADPSQARLDLH